MSEPFVFDVMVRSRADNSVLWQHGWPDFAEVPAPTEVVPTAMARAVVAGRYQFGNPNAMQR